MYDLLEDHRIHILAQHVEEKEVSHLGLSDDNVDAFFLDQAEADVQQVGPHPRRHDDDQSVEHDHEGHGGQQQEPEPEEDVNLFVDNIDGQDAEGVVALDLARRAKLVEGALGHSREDVDDGVDPVLLVPQGEGDDLHAKCEEGPP